MTLEELSVYFENPDRVRIYKGDKEVCCGYWASFTMNGRGIEQTSDLFIQYKGDEVKRFRAVPEMTHKKWRELNLMRPLMPEETADYSFSDLQMSLYYTVWI